MSPSWLSQLDGDRTGSQLYTVQVAAIPLFQYWIEPTTIPCIRYDSHTVQYVTCTVTTAHIEL